MRIGIFETGTERKIAEYNIHLQGISYTPTTDEAYEEAWNCAAEDGVADTESRDDYEFKELD